MSNARHGTSAVVVSLCMFCVPERLLIGLLLPHTHTHVRAGLAALLPWHRVPEGGERVALRHGFSHGALPMLLDLVWCPWAGFPLPVLVWRPWTWFRGQMDRNTKIICLAHGTKRIIQYVFNTERVLRFPWFARAWFARHAYA